MIIPSNLGDFIDKFGLLTPDGEPSGNGILYTAEFCIAHPSFDNTSEFKNAIFRCEVGPGLLRRNPEKLEDYEGPDDYIGAISASWLFASCFLRHGQAHATQVDLLDPSPAKVRLSRILFLVLSLFGLRKVRRVYNNVRPGQFAVSSWFGRFPHLFAHAKFKAGKTPTVLETAWWLGVVLSTALISKREHDNHWALSWHLVVVAYDSENVLVRWARRFWQRRFKRAFPHGMGELRASYFKNPDHPLVHLLWDDFG